MIAAVLFNLAVLGINWGVAEPHGRERIHPPQDDIILSIMIASTILINLFVVLAILGTIAIVVPLLSRIFT